MGQMKGDKGQKNGAQKSTARTAIGRLRVLYDYIASNQRRKKMITNVLLKQKANNQKNHNATKSFQTRSDNGHARLVELV